MSRSPTHALPNGDGLPAQAVRTELAQILASDLFSRSERLSAFLKFVVEQTLDGHGDELKEHVLAIELYGKGVDFAAAADPIVRVDARRLRDKLREYYAAAPRHAVVISIPKGSYTPVFDAHETGAAPGFDVASAPLREAMADVSAPRRRSRLWLFVVASLLAGGVAWIALGRRTASSAPSPFRLLTVTAFPGAEGMPSLSPDGNFVVFTATGPDFTNTADVWVKEVDGDMVRRLTDTPQFHEALPSWSPDGRQIAFQRNEGIVSRGVYLSASGSWISIPQPPRVPLPTARRSATRRAWTCPDRSPATESMSRSRRTAVRAPSYGWPNARGPVSGARQAFRRRPRMPDRGRRITIGWRTTPS
jgi:WD40-like Beta Propeller Repeat